VTGDLLPTRIQHIDVQVATQGSAKNVLATDEVASVAMATGLVNKAKEQNRLEALN
jgi:hypothetical protein